jgi:hypothetical protein
MVIPFRVGSMSKNNSIETASHGERVGAQLCLAQGSPPRRALSCEEPAPDAGDLVSAMNRRNGAAHQALAITPDGRNSSLRPGPFFLALLAPKVSFIGSASTAD